MKNELKQAVLSCLEHESTSHVEMDSVGGGDINEAVKLTLGKKPYFIKWNSSSLYPRMFELEAEGLRNLAATNAIRIPNIVATGETDADAFLILEFIENGKKGPAFWEDFGKRLALLHKTTHKLFGFESDNYIGSLFQSNSQLRNWTDFYVVNRLDAQFEMAFNKGLFHQSVSRLINKLYKNLEALIPEEKPALIHGDLWSGNYLVDEKGGAVLIDPSVYYGHREMDLAMMKLFGGFDKKMFQTYQQHFPLQDKWEERIPIHQLYPLLVHVNLFGGGYVNQVEGILKRFA